MKTILVIPVGYLFLATLACGGSDDDVAASGGSGGSAAAGTAGAGGSTGGTSAGGAGGAQAGSAGKGQGGAGNGPSGAGQSQGGAGQSQGGSAQGGAGMGGAGGAGAGGGSCPAGGGGVTRLSVSGTQILDPRGQRIGLGVWTWGQWGSVQDGDAADHAKQGANIVRIPLRWWGVYNNEGPDADPITRIDARDDSAPGGIEVHHLAAIEAEMDAAACQGLWIDLFLDSNCGQASAQNGTVAYCGAAPDGSGTPANFVNDPETTKKFVAAWQFLVDRYKNRPYIGVYEILPEPQMGCQKPKCDDWTVAPKFYAPIIDKIRAIDPTTPLMIGPDNAYDVIQIDTAYIPGATGIIYTGNFLNATSAHPEYVTQYMTPFRDKRQVPVFIQQLGVRKDETDAATRATTMLKAANDAGIGWTWWTYRETRSPSGGGYAPFWEDKGPPWMSDPTWLQMISDAFH